MSQFDQIDIRRLDMTLLLVFSELLRQRKLRTVGERLGLTQSAVSHALKRLRDIFGHELFVRRPHGVEPTARAVELEPLVDRILGLAHDVLMTKEAFDPAKVRRTLRIGMLDYGAILLGPKFLASTRAVAPELRVAIWFFGRAAAYSALASGEIDIASESSPARRRTTCARSCSATTSLSSSARAIRASAGTSASRSILPRTTSWCLRPGSCAAMSTAISRRSVRRAAMCWRCRRSSPRSRWWAKPTLSARCRAGWPSVSPAGCGCDASRRRSQPGRS